MQTFLPYADFERSAAVLDNRRLTNQLNECKVILENVLNVSQGWQSHPVVQMWSEHACRLAEYGVALAEEFSTRAKETHPHHQYFTDQVFQLGDNGSPWWLGEEIFHLSHRAKLMRKDPDHYSSFFPDVDLELPVIYPTQVDLVRVFRIQLNPTE